MSSYKTAKGTELPILVLKGKDYLEVKYRLVWFREDHPDWSIETEFVSITEKSSTAKATVRDATGRIISTSHKFENAQGFPDFLEKSETGAIGRALALIGYGTQFCADELDEGKRIVDSPVSPKGAIISSQPGPEDGNTESPHYKVTFGKWAQRTLEEIERSHGGDAIADYIDYIKESAKKKNTVPTGPAAEFIVNATLFLRALEGPAL